MKSSCVVKVIWNNWNSEMPWIICDADFLDVTMWWIKSYWPEVWRRYSSGQKFCCQQQTSIASHSSSIKGTLYIAWLTLAWLLQLLITLTVVCMPLIGLEWEAIEVCCWQPNFCPELYPKDLACHFLNEEWCSSRDVQALSAIKNESKHFVKSQM